MKIVTDFDGVWTDPRAEAEGVWEFMQEELSACSRLPMERIATFLKNSLRTIQESPADHGWRVENHITAYADEDPFCLHGAICALLDRSAGGEWDALRSAVIRTYGSTDAFGGHCHKSGVARHMARHGPSMHRDAAAWIRTLVEAGWEVVVVSNSSEEKLRTCFGHLGVEPGVAPYSSFRMRGGAMKFIFTAGAGIPGGESIRDFAGRPVRLDRGHYLRVLREERPDVVVGDVFSLDLALPSLLREQDPAFENLDIVLIENPYTPDWTRRAVRGRLGVSTVASVGALVSRLVERHPV